MAQSAPRVTPHRPHEHHAGTNVLERSHEIGILKLLFDTGRYQNGDKDFHLVTTVDLGDGEVPERVQVGYTA